MKTPEVKRILLISIVVALFIYSGNLLIDTPPSADLLIVWVRWPMNLRGWYMLEDHDADNFISFLWAKTKKDDWSRTSQYRTIDIFLMESIDNPMKGYHVQAGSNNVTFEDVVKFSELAAKGKKLSEEEEEELAPVLRPYIQQIYRVYEN